MLLKNSSFLTYMSFSFINLYNNKRASAYISLFFPFNIEKNLSGKISNNFIIYKKDYTKIFKFCIVFLYNYLILYCIINP